MLKLEEGMLLYHGSYTSIEKIDLAKCSDNKDFGKGFYLTTSLNQAKKFVKNSIFKGALHGYADKNATKGYVSVFRLISLDGIDFYSFKSANRSWLQYITSNRKPPLFKKKKEMIDRNNVIAGKIADDRTSATLLTYISSERVGEKEFDEFIINLLLPNKLDDQYCFKDEKSIKCLEFVESIEVNINE